MSRPTLTRMATACAAAVPAVVVAQAPAPAGADLIESCTTYTLPVEEVEEGATSEVTCEWVDPEEIEDLSLLSTTVGSHYQGAAGSGSVLTVTGNCGESLGFSPSDPWNNIISSSRQRSCAGMKHWSNGNLTGDQEGHTGPSGSLINLTTMDNRTSSIMYYA